MKKPEFTLGNAALAGVFFLAASAAVILPGSLGFFGSLSWRSLSPGQVADQDVVVDRDIWYIDTQATKLRLDAQRALAKPVFTVHEEIGRRIIEKYDQIFTILSAAWVKKKNVESTHLELQSVLPGLLTRSQVSVLLSHRELPGILEEVRTLVVSAVGQGFLGPTVTQNLSGGLETLRTQGNKIQRQLWDSESLLRLGDLRAGWDRLVSSGNLRPGFTEAALILVSAVAEENLFYDHEESLRNLQRVDRDTPPVRRQLSKGEWIIRKDYVVSQEAMSRLQALLDHYGGQSLSKTLAVLVFMAILSVVGYYLFFAMKLNHLSREILLALGGMWLVHLLVLSLTVSSQVEAPELLLTLVPTVLMVIMATLLVDERTGLFFALVTTLPLLLLVPERGGVFLGEFFAALTVPLVLRRVHHRMDLIKAGLWIALIQGLFGLLPWLLHGRDYSLGLLVIAAGGVNGFVSALLALGLLPILEHLLNSPTTFRLTELADLNTPVLKRLLDQAPGTYAHSLNVAQLAEQAALGIGADPLLCKVGGIYHDLGKIDQSDYFIENQRGHNRHDELKPQKSVAILKSHVINGLEKARELRLPAKIRDIIAQHHGTGLISFFYDKALKEHGEGRVNRQDYCYPGPNPDCRESAIVMLADTVEAASRTLRDPSPERISAFVWDLMMKRYEEGLLVASGLSFSDLESIRSIFTHVLAGQFHTRIDYPQQPAPREEYSVAGN